jgi:hypothetical protein
VRDVEGDVVREDGAQNVAALGEFDAVKVLVLDENVLLLLVPADPVLGDGQPIRARNDVFEQKVAICKWKKRENRQGMR